MNVLAKFKVSSITILEGYSVGSDGVYDTRLVHEIKMHGVKGEPFGSATPNASISMVVANEEAYNQFSVGKEYFVTFFNEG